MIYSETPTLMINCTASRSTKHNPYIKGETTRNASQIDHAQIINQKDAVYNNSTSMKIFL